MRTSILFLAAFLSLSLASAATVVSESVGQVGERVVTSREVQISAVLDRILFPGKDAKTVGTAYEIHIGDPGMMNEVTAVLLEVVVFKEAESFAVSKVSEEQVQQAVRKVEAAVEGKSYWQSLEVGPAELKRFVHQKLVAKAFIQFKTSTMVGIISDSEAMAYYEKNRLKFGDMPFSTFKDTIKNVLAQQQLEERTRTWFELTKRKYKVRNILAENVNNKVGPK